MEQFYSVQPGAAGPAAAHAIINEVKKAVCGKDEIIERSVKFVEDVVKLKGEEVGIRESRSRAAYFIRGMRGAASVRDELNHATDLGEFCRALAKLKDM